MGKLVAKTGEPVGVSLQVQGEDRHIDERLSIAIQELPGALVQTRGVDRELCPGRSRLADRPDSVPAPPDP